ncbi:VanZ family protein [Clostridium perfringens]|uniref:VanZ family protein n=1 Tax=Clostridium perfringens TaxID=1502 RepID=UPI0024BCF346|nr:VanZ family protein [Clostridium perfringens]MDK0751827.1 VanZ family protein [Clostridium perfringens]MDM0889289.1 VanZ family protein [Clostridium perfringens]MDM0901126.1 VanZ family protein [Clostridium perfringens]MDM0907021.1 VanZ family protein [Clostridium perfringens]MDM0909946.1 VanZ family protein [Clostridium perfringens]
MENKRKRIIAWSLIIFWMAFIFFMSSQPGEVSSKQSNFIVILLDMFGMDLNSRFGELSTFIIRKGAHFTEYMILYFLAFNLLRLYITRKKAYIYSLIIVFGYACSDEFHQLFVEGRSGQFKDVLIDTSGGIFGSLLVALKSKIFSNKA